VCRVKPLVELYLCDGTSHFKFINADLPAVLTPCTWLERYFSARWLL
jgi:hypothetical protein